MILDATTKSLEIDLNAAATTNNMPVTVDYVDMTTTTTVAGSSDTASNGTTAVTILAAPAASTQRKVNSLSVYNADTASKIVTIQLNNNTTLRSIVVVDLQVGETLGYTDTQGWFVLTSAGTIKQGQAIAAQITNTPAGNIAATTVQSALNELDNEKAALAGSASQVFSVGTATSAAHAARLDQISLLPTVASATAPDIFGAAGVTINYTGTTTATSLAACTAAQVGSKKTIIPETGASFTASANLIVDGATSGTYLMPANEVVEVIALTTTKFSITTKVTTHGTQTVTGTKTLAAPIWLNDSTATAIAAKSCLRTTGIGASAVAILPVTPFGNGAGSTAHVKVYGTNNAGNTFFDILIASDLASAATVLTSTTIAGTPAARTYSVVSGALKVSLASGTYTVNVSAEWLKYF